MIALTPERVIILKILLENGEMRSSEILKLHPYAKKISAISNLAGRLQGMLCVINTKYGHYKISEVGKMALLKYLQIEDISENLTYDFYKHITRVSND